MAKVALLFGFLLIALGVVGYMGTGSSEADSEEVIAADTFDEEQTDDKTASKGKSKTALIPSAFGILLVLFGLLAQKESLRKHAMHGAAMVGLLGTLAGAGRGMMGIGKFLSGDPSLNQRSFLFVWLMAILCGVFLFLCVKSFIAARKRQENAVAGDAEASP